MQFTPVDSITLQSPVSIPFPQLEPHGSETRDRGVLFCAGERLGELSAGFARVCDDLAASKSLSRRRARPDVFTRSALRWLHFWPKLSVVSLSRAAWVIEGLASLFRSQPTGVGFGKRSQPQNQILGLMSPSGGQLVVWKVVGYCTRPFVCG